MNRSLLPTALAALLAVLACSTADSRSVATARFDALRSALASSVHEETRLAAMTPHVDAMQDAMLAMFDGRDRLLRRFAIANAAPDATRDELLAIARELAQNRRAGMQKVLEARLALRRDMTAVEWAAFAEALPAFDGGQS